MENVVQTTVKLYIVSGDFWLAESDMTSEVSDMICGYYKMQKIKVQCWNEE